MVQEKRQLELKTFTDVDREGSVDDRKSTNGGAFFLGKRLVSWTSKKQNFILNLNTHNIIESAHVRVNEFAKKGEDESSK